MASDRVPPDREPTPLAEGRTTRDRDADDPVGYDALVRRYGDAMLRIGQLEVEVDRLARRFQETVTDGVGPIGTGHHEQMPDIKPILTRIEALEQRNLLARIEEMEYRLGSSWARDSAEDSPAASEDGEAPAGQRDAEVSQFRLHIAGLSSQLKRTEDQLRDLQRSNGRHRSRNKSKWKLWRPWRRY